MAKRALRDGFNRPRIPSSRSASIGEHLRFHHHVQGPVGNIGKKQRRLNVDLCVAVTHYLGKIDIILPSPAPSNIGPFALPSHPTNN